MLDGQHLLVRRILATLQSAHGPHAAHIRPYVLASRLNTTAVHPSRIIQELKQAQLIKTKSRRAANLSLQRYSSEIGMCSA